MSGITFVVTPGDILSGVLAGVVLIFVGAIALLAFLTRPKP
ncbi:MAG TPA: hypothetical protein VHM19_22990 [Polyangiales bacterium]|jgi:hypothetical protein|nr:hypothetical protein [Polyangiales bacterium]